MRFYIVQAAQLGAGVALRVAGAAVSRSSHSGAPEIESAGRSVRRCVSSISGSDLVVMQPPPALACADFSLFAGQCKLRSSNE